MQPLYTLLLQAGLCVGLGAVFVASALPKLRHPRGFVLAVMEYRILPPRPSRAAGRVIPPLELLLGVLLLSGTSVALAAGLVAALLAVFIAAVGINLRRGRTLECHCFGKKSQRRIGWRVIVEDAALLAGCVVIVLTTSGGATWLASWSLWRASRLVGWGPIAAIWPVLICVGLAIAGALALDPAMRRRVRRRSSRHPARQARAARHRGTHVPAHSTAVLQPPAHGRNGLQAPSPCPGHLWPGGKDNHQSWPGGGDNHQSWPGGRNDHQSWRLAASD